uniref:Uncharacterized protein n=1 Tax=Zea mays TaxID=4577 RepID=C4J3H2_MAIZE|nr:unknown [Zea mays]|eukprot:NP_001183108.1 uncharacterized protein LOC100501473 [Zea mays]
MQTRLSRMSSSVNSASAAVKRPRKAEALTGVAVRGLTRASHAGMTPERPMTHRYRACPSMATMSEVRMPRLAPAPTTLDTHAHRSRPLNAPENGASGSIAS